MNPQQFIQQELQNLSTFEPKKVNKENLAGEIFRLLMSKKFRKYSANPQLIEKIKSAIALNIRNNEPINLTFPHGAYKLWRLEEAPLPDWAELFAVMYYTKWLKPICEIYTPGVWFDFFVDDLIIPKLNNIPFKDVEAYIEGFQTILEFIKTYQPKNLKMTITRFETLFKSQQEFETSLATYVDRLSKSKPVFTEDQLIMVELNAHPTSEQLTDPQWREKIRLIHDAYINMKRDIGYYFQPSKIPVFNQPLASGVFLAVGTTKTSIAKFWVGVGALKKDNETFKEYVLSPKQLRSTTFTKEPVNLDGLDLKNFKNIRVFSTYATMSP